MKCYRVTMCDGYAGLYDAENEEDAKKQAIAVTEKNIAGCAMEAWEKKNALTVESVKRLTD